MKTAWYTAMSDGARGKVVPISGPYETKEEADSFVSSPGSRDRIIAEAIDPRAHFFNYITVHAAATLKPIINDPRVQKILEAKEIALV